MEVHRALGGVTLSDLKNLDTNKYLPGVQAEEASLGEKEVLRLLADLAREPEAADHLTQQETTFTAALYHEYLSDGGIVDNTITQKAANYLGPVSRRSGGILGALQIGGALHRDAELADKVDDAKQAQRASSNARTFVQSLLNIGITAGTLTDPVAGEAAKNITSALLGNLQDPQTHDYSGRAAYDTSIALQQGASTAQGLLEHAIFLNALPEINKTVSFTGQDGSILPADQWEDEQKVAWKKYLEQLQGYEERTGATKDAFESGVQRAEKALGVSLESLNGSKR